MRLHKQVVANIRQSVFTACGKDFTSDLAWNQNLQFTDSALTMLL